MDTSEVTRQRNSTEEPYDPYKHRSGHVSNAFAFFHLVKCSVGSGILALPYGFKNAGMIGGFILALLITAFVIYSFLLLIRMIVQIASEKKVPYVNLREASKYSMNHSHRCLAKLSAATGVTVDAMFILNYVGTCAAYYSYVVICTLTIAGYDKYAEGPVNMYRAAATALWLLPFFAINCIRDLKSLAPTSIVGNILILSSMVAVLYFILYPDDKGFSTTWTYFGNWETTPLFVGLMIFSLGSIGVGLSVEKDMINPAAFVGWFGMFNTSTILVGILYMTIASLGYWKYGDDTKSTIVMTLPTDHEYWLVALVQVSVALALFFSYPLMCFIIFDVTWFGMISPKLENLGRKRQYLWEYLYRIGVTTFTGLIALVVPRLDLILSLVGALSICFLGLILPGILEYNYTYEKHGFNKPWTLAKDVALAIVGLFCLIVGTYSALYSIVVESITSRM